jgi:hypothetical protein
LKIPSVPFFDRDFVEKRIAREACRRAEYARHVQRDLARRAILEQAR